MRYRAERDVEAWVYAAAAVALVALVVGGLWVASKRPPRLVADRYHFTSVEYMSTCVGYDGKGNCTSSTLIPYTVQHWVLVSTDGGHCETNEDRYFAIRKGEPHKCWQLFGWRGGRDTDADITRLAGSGW